MKIPLLAVAVMLSPVVSRAEEQTVKKSFPAKEVAALKVDSAAGDVSVKSGSGEFAVVVDHYDSERCELVMEVKDRILVLRTKSRHKLSAKGCEAGVSIVGPSVKLEASSGAGSIDFDGLTAPVRASTGAGEIGGTLAGASAELSTGAGSIDVTWTKAPAEGQVRASTGAGTVRLAFPGGTKLAADLSAGLGSVENALGDDKSSRLKVRASTGVGTVSLERS